MATTPTTPVAQPQWKLDLVNEMKEVEERLLRRMADIALTPQEVEGVSPIDGRWAAIAKTHIEQGFMAMNRAIMQPQRVTLAEDEE